MYAKVENNSVVKFQNDLPKSTNRTSNFKSLSVSEQIEQGWYPCEEIEVDSDYEGELIEIQSQKVIRRNKPIIPTLAELKEVKLNTLNAKLKVEIDKGFTYNGWNYPISENTVNNIVKQETMIKIAERNNVTIDTFQLTDGSNVDRTFTLEQYNVFALGYAVIVAKIEKWYANKRNLITNATTELVLDSIILDFPSEEE